MTFLYPIYFGAASAVAVGLIALHFLTQHEARETIFPTVRFVPESNVKARSMTRRFSDALLLFIRVLSLLLIGAAFAQPSIQRKKKDIERIIVVDNSQMTDQRALQDSLAHYRAKPVSVVGATSHFISAGLIKAFHSAAEERNHTDSIDLVMLSAFPANSSDAASLPLRALWPGRIRIVSVPRNPESSTGFARNWPVVVEWADSVSSRRWTARLRPDTVGAVGTRNAVLVHPFVRRWILRDTSDKSSHVFARWYDGEPAALEFVEDGRCTRSISFSLPAEGDVILRAEFARFVSELSVPCQVYSKEGSLSPAYLDSLRGVGINHLAPAASIRPRSNVIPPSVPWLFAFAIGLMLLELLLRRARAGVDSI